MSHRPMAQTPGVLSPGPDTINSRQMTFHFSFSNSSFAFSSSTSSWSLTFGYFNPSDFNLATMISATQIRVNHLWSAGMMYQGAHSVLVWLNISSYASM